MQEFQHKDPLLTVEECADHLNTSPRMVRRMVAERRVPVVRIGRHVRIRLSALDRYLMQRTTPARGDAS